jgi:hypothetical protein
MQQIAIWELEGISGTEEFSGTSDTQITQTNMRNICDDSGSQYFFGQISNLSNVDCRLQLYFSNNIGQMHTHDLRAKESFDLRGLPVTRMCVLINGTVKVHGMGTIVQAETPSDHVLCIQNTNMAEHLAYYRTYRFNHSTHTDISTATTTTICDPSDDKSARPFKIVMRSAGANIITLQTTDSDGTSNAQIIGSYEFTAGGTAEVNWGANGWEVPNGKDGLIRAVTTQAVDVDIDVTYDERDDQ